MTSLIGRSRTTVGIVYLALFALCYAGVMATLVSQWTNNTIYSYGFAVPFISGYMAWHILRGSTALQAGGDYLLGVPMTIAGLTLLVVGHLGAVTVVQEISLIVSLVGVILVLFGRQAALQLWFPILFLFSMVPIWDAPIAGLHGPGQLLSARIAVGLLHFFGVPALRQDTIIVMPNLALQVARECSGVNQLIAVVAMALPAAYLMLDGYARRILLTTFAVAVACLSNGVRVALIGLLAYKGVNGGDVHGPFHILQGLAVSVVGYAVILGCLSFLSKRQKPRREGFASHRQLSDGPRAVAIRRPALEIGLALIVLVAGGYHSLFRPEVISLNSSLHELPGRIDEWTTDTLTSPFAGVRFDGVDDELVRVYRSTAGDRVRLYVGYHRFQEQGKELIGDASAALNGAASPMTLRTDPGRSIDINQVVRQQPGTQRQILFWYDLNGRLTGNTYLAKIYTVLDALTRRRTNGAVVVVEWDRPAGGEPDISRQPPSAFVRALLPVLREYLPS